MRSWRALLLLAGGLAACRFSVAPIDFDAGIATDLAPSGPRDLAPGLHGDLAPGGDMACSDSGCPFGCSATPVPHCKGLQPSGVVTAADYGDPGLFMQTATGDVVINTNTGAITGGITRAAGAGVINGIGFRAAAQLNGPTVGIFGVAGLSLPSNSKITFTGSSAFALASRGNVTIAGTIDGSCSMAAGGPGGSLGGTGTLAGLGGGLGGGPGGAMGPNGASGGGGAGFGDIGGTGAAGMGLGVTASGAIWGNITPSGALVLVGGSGGGAGGVNPNPGGGPGPGPGPAPPGNDGGGGGGAIQLSVNGALTLSGTLDVGGCGGKPGSSGGGGGGGGSGGAIVMEAGSIAITTTAIVTANGGGGGGGDTGGPGGDGAAGSMSAPGGAGGDNGNDGGSGGARGAQAGLHNTEGGNAPQVKMFNYGGGGGGGAGRILLRALMAPSDQASVVSPDPSDINHKGQRMTTFDTAVFQ